MKQFVKRIIPAAVTMALTSPQLAFATNGMNLEGFGPVAHSMGGASMAYDNGTAAVMNNPATLGLMQSKSRLDIAIGFLGPNVTVKAPGAPDADSSGDAYFMPAAGWAQKTNQFTYGVGLFSQGGMGTEYTGDSFLAAGSGETVRSEVGVGRLIAPLTYNINNQWVVGGSLDFVWAGMDIKMALPGDAMLGMATGTSEFGTASGEMIETLKGMMPGLDPNNPVNWARFDFSDSSAFTGEAKGYGFAGKLGLVYSPNANWSFGTTYHSKTNLGDLETDNATVSMSVNMGGNALAVPVKGKITVKDFQWPATFAIGTAYHRDKWMFAADIKQIFWKDVMKDFKMEFVASANQAQAAQGFAGQNMDVVLFQEWDDQTVLQIGGGYQATKKLVVRAGWNYGKNPIPDKYLHPLFPAITENHLTTGLGYDIDKNSDINFSLVYALETENTSGSGVTVSHSQLSWQFMYSYLW